jgi:tetrahydromethanopterin S-methyltransferase subunit G
VDVLSLRHSGRSRDPILDQDHDDVAALKVRVDRIERRLELTDK